MTEERNLDGEGAEVWGFGMEEGVVWGFFIKYWLRWPI